MNKMRSESTRREEERREKGGRLEEKMRARKRKIGGRKGE